MRRPIPTPDQKKVAEKLKKAYQPLVDHGVPEEELIKLLSSHKFWSSNKMNRTRMVNELVKNYVKESEENEETEKEPSCS